MDKNILLQLTETVKEIEDLKRRIADAEKKREQYEKLRVSDVVKGTKTEWMINGPIKVTGIDMKDVAYQEKLLVRRLESMQRLLDKLERQKTEAEEYIANLKGSRERQIARYKCIDNLGWQEIAKKMGTTPDGVRMEFNRLFKTGSQ